MIQLCGKAQGDLAHSLVNYEMAVETKVISPIQQLLEVSVHQPLTCVMIVSISHSIV